MIIKIPVKDCNIKEAIARAVVEHCTSNPEKCTEEFAAAMELFNNWGRYDELFTLELDTKKQTIKVVR